MDEIKKTADPSVSSDSFTSSISSGTDSTGNDSAIGSISSPSVLEGVLNQFEQLSPPKAVPLLNNFCKHNGRPQNVHQQMIRQPRLPNNVNAFKQAVHQIFNEFTNAESVKQGILDYFSQLGGDVNSLIQNSVANRQLDELCELYCFTSKTNAKFDFAMTALFEKVLANVTSYTFANKKKQATNSMSNYSNNNLKDKDSYYALTVNIVIPDNPECNLIGRILGPRGMSVRELEKRFNCRIFVRGKGSIRDPEKAEKLKNKPGWEHLSDNLHVHIQVAGYDKEETEQRLAEIKRFIERLLHPQGFDAFKRRQLISLAFMNGTFRPPPHLKHLQFNRSEAPTHDRRVTHPPLVS